MTDTLPRVITFEEIKVGDTIRAECTDRGMHVTRQGVVDNVNSLLAATQSRGVLTYGNGDIITLLDRPAPPRMDEPTRLGSVVVVTSRAGRRVLALRTLGGAWLVGVNFYDYDWDELVDPRPVTEQEIEEGRVIEP